MEGLKKVSPEEVFHELVVSQSGEELAETYEEALEEAKKHDLETKKELAKIKDFPETHEELFNDDEIEWFEVDLEPETDFVNRIFDAGSGLLPPLGTKASELKEKFHQGNLDRNHHEKIEKIRNSLKERPRAIVLTKDFYEHVMYDGGHRGLAFMIEGKKIPALVGKRSYFRSFKA